MNTQELDPVLAANILRLTKNAIHVRQYSGSGLYQFKINDQWVVDPGLTEAYLYLKVAGGMLAPVGELISSEPLENIQGLSNKANRLIDDLKSKITS